DVVEALERLVQDCAALAPVGDVRRREQHLRPVRRETEPLPRLTALDGTKAFKVDAIRDPADREAGQERALRRRALDPPRRGDDRQLRAAVNLVLPAPQ